MTEQYGPPIPVNGVRPEWLRNGDICFAKYGIWGSYSMPAIWWQWATVTAILLPITHPASICQQRALDHPDEAPFYPVHADGTVPVDYDGGRVLLRIGGLGAGINWKENGYYAIVGYRRKATTAGPISTCAPERFAGTCPIEEAAKRIYAHWEFGDNAPGKKPEWVEGGNSMMQDVARRFARAAIPATHVLVERMTEAEARDALGAFAGTGGTVGEWLAAIGIIKPDPDPIAEYAVKHSLDVDELRALVKGAAA